MSSQEFFKTRAALVTTIAACLVVIVSLGIRQTFGLFFFDFEVDLGCTQTEFGFAMGVQLFMWGLFGRKVLVKCQGVIFPNVMRMKMPGLEPIKHYVNARIGGH